MTNEQPLPPRDTSVFRNNRSPGVIPDTHYLGELSTRDHFAGIALAALLRHDVTFQASHADKAYKIADAMLAARERGET